MAIELPENVILRPQTEADTDFIYSAWLKSYRKRADVVPYFVYYKLYQQILDRLLNRAPAKVVIAAFAPRPEQIMGFIAYETDVNGQNIVHYVYVKHTFRGCDIGRALLQHATNEDPHWYYTFRPKGDLAHKFRQHGGQYAPHLIRGELSD